MGLFDYIFRPRQAKESQKALESASGFYQTLTAYQPIFTTWSGCLYESELVRSAIDARARHISKLKVNFEGTANPKLQSKMRLAPSRFQTYSQMLYRLSTILDNCNTAILTPIFDETMTITGYFPVLPQSVELLEYKGEPWIKYQFGNGNQGAVELRKCAVLTRFQYRNDFFGESNFALHDTMQLAHIQSQAIQESAKNSSTFRFMARLDNFALSADLKKERERFVENNMSSGNGGLLLFPNTYSDIKQINQTAYAVDQTQREAIENNVHDYFGVNRNILQNKATADDLDAFYEGCIEPFAIMLSEAWSMAMFSERERAQGSRVIVNANRLQYMSTQQKVAMAQQMLDRGVMTINEARELFNYDPVEGGDVRAIRGEYKNTLDIEGEEDNADQE